MAGGGSESGSACMRDQWPCEQGMERTRVLIQCIYSRHALSLFTKSGFPPLNKARQSSQDGVGKAGARVAGRGLTADGEAGGRRSAESRQGGIMLDDILQIWPVVRARLCVAEAQKKRGDHFFLPPSPAIPA